MIIENILADPETVLAWLVSVGIPAAYGIYQKYLKGVIVDLMNPNVPQTSAQTKIIASGKVPDSTWKMTDSAKESLFQDLRNHGAEIRKDDLLAVIAKAEAECQVEYGIILHNHSGNIDRSIINKGNLIGGKFVAGQEHEVYHGFVSYGNYSTQAYTDTLAKVTETASKSYPLEIYWYMTDAEYDKVMLTIGYDNPKCITEAQNTIKKAEVEQWESYYLGCGNHTFKVVQGNLTEVGANPKTDAPKETT